MPVTKKHTIVRISKEDINTISINSSATIKGYIVDHFDSHMGGKGSCHTGE